jgi:Zn-dependent metalloprotease
MLTGMLTGAALGWVTLAAGCAGDASQLPASGEKDQAGLQLPAGPVAAQPTLGQLGFHTAALGRAGTPMYLSGHVPAAVRDGETASQAVLANLATAYRLAAATSFAVLSDAVDKDPAQGGRRYVKLQQLHAGVPVVGGELVVQVESDGAIGAVLGEPVADLQMAPHDPAAAPLAGDEALRRGLSAVARMGSAEILEPPSLRIYAIDNSAPELVYRALVRYIGDEGLRWGELFVSARDGRVVAMHDQIYTALARTVYTWKNCFPISGGLPGTKSRDEGDAAGTDDTVNNVYAHDGNTYWFYKNFLNRDSYDDKGAPIHSSVHGTFFGGTGCTPDNAAWIQGAAQMVYGDGDGMLLKDLSIGIDVTGHELTHGVTFATSALAYMNESGALNEGLSDIFGSGIHAWRDAGGSAAGNPAVITYTSDIWMLGKEVAGPKLPGGSLRFMDNPTKDGHSTDYYPERVMPGGPDNGGVHYNSGLANLAHVLLSDGGHHPRSKTTVEVPKIGIEKALHIFYLSNTKLFTSTTTFQLARYAMAQAAENLYGRCSAERNAVHLAWDALGVPGAWSRCVKPLPPTL